MLAILFLSFGWAGHRPKRSDTHRTHRSTPRTHARKCASSSRSIVGIARIARVALPRLWGGVDAVSVVGVLHFALLKMHLVHKKNLVRARLVF